MMKCKAVKNGRECGNIIPETASFCSECCSRTPDTVIQHCSCGVILRGSEKFCWSCGQPVCLPDSAPQKCLGKLSDGSACGYTLIPFLDFCPKCGTKKSTDSDQEPPTSGSETALQQAPREDSFKQREDVEPAVVKAVSTQPDGNLHSDEKNAAGTETLEYISGGNGKPASSGNETTLQQTPREDSFKQEGDVEPAVAKAVSSPPDGNLHCNEKNAAGTETLEYISGGNGKPARSGSEIALQQTQEYNSKQGEDGVKHTVAKVASTTPYENPEHDEKIAAEMGTMKHASGGDDSPRQLFSQYANLSWTQSEIEKEINTVEKTKSNEDMAHGEENNPDSDAEDAKGITLSKNTVVGSATGHTQSTDLVSASENHTKQKEVNAAEGKKSDELQKEKKSCAHGDVGLQDNSGDPAPNTESNRRLQEKMSAVHPAVDAYSTESSRGAAKQTSEDQLSARNKDSDVDSSEDSEGTNNSEAENSEEKENDDAEQKEVGTKNKKTQRKMPQSNRRKIKKKKKQKRQKKKRLQNPTAAMVSDPLGVQGNEVELAEQQSVSNADGAKGAKDKEKEKTRPNTSKKNNPPVLKPEDTEVTVVFHVIISTHFKVEAQADSVYIRCEPPSLGGFNQSTDKNRLKCVRNTDLGPLYEGRINMSKNVRNQGFRYKYVVKKIEKDKIKWEYVMKSTRRQIEDRLFSIDSKQKSSADDWHRYDGVAYPESFKDSVLKKIGYYFGATTYQEKVRQEAVSSGKEFLPSPEVIQQALLNPVTPTSSKQTAEGFLTKIGNVMSSLKLQLLDTGLERLDGELEKKCVFDNLIEPLVSALQKSLQENLYRRTATLGLFIWLLKSKFGVYLEGKMVNQLCRSLLLFPDLENRTCPDLEDLEAHFPAMMSDRNALTRSVSQLIDKSDVDGPWKRNPSWWCCVPLLHFLDGSSIPFQEPGPSTNFKSKHWWGITSFADRKDRFKSSVLVKTETLMEFVELLEPCFAADPLLSRSIVASLEFDPLIHVLLKVPIPFEVMAATLIHHLQEKSYHLIGSSEKMVVEVVNKMKSTVTHSSEGEELEDDQLKKLQCQSQMAQELLSTILGLNLNIDEELMFVVIDVVFLALDQCAIVEETTCKKKNAIVSQEWHRNATDVIRKVCDTIIHSYSLFLSGCRKDKLPMHLKVWGKLFRKAEDLTSEPLKQHLEKLITENFEFAVNQLPASDKLDVYLNQMDQIVPAFVGILNRLTFESLEDAFKEGSAHLVVDNIRLISLLSDLLERKWRKASSEGKEIFVFILTWVPMVNYLQRFNDQKRISNMGEYAKKIITNAIASVNNHVELLFSGDILVSTLQFILSCHDQFCCVVTAAGCDRTKTETVLALRRHELDSYMQIACQLDKLFEYCHYFLKTGDFDEIHTKIEQQREKTGKCMLREVVEVSLPDDTKNLNEYKPKSNPWDFPEEILAILPEFQENIISIIFEKMFRKTGEKMCLATVSFWRAFLNLWQEVTQEWQVLCEKMMDGSITLASTERVFSMLKTGDEAYNFIEIAVELKKMRNSAGGGSEDWVDQRISQFSCYMTIKKHVVAAGALLKIREAFKIKGNFSDIETICSLSHNATLPIRDLDKSMLDLCKQLDDIIQLDVRCLEGLQQQRCVEFFEWLKKNMKDGLKELNVFVDLAFISAGEEPYAIDRVNYFHAAATGYAPLIFTEKVKGYKSLLKQCKLVFANVQANSKLPEKLAATVQYLDWFKDVQKSHGSVERTSMSQVGNINARGLFRLGRGAKRGMDLHRIILLSVSEDNEGKIPARQYSYEELLDLQSRLMLVAGQAEKGKENVDRFITVMESLVRLGKTYVQLCKDGCVLFLDWGVKFLCDVERPVCCVSEFSKQGKLKGHRTLGGHGTGKAEEMEDFIAGVAGFLEHCHREWLVYVDQKRKDYPELNVYTVEQLVFLQQQLVKVGFGDVSNLVFPMLSLLKADCSPKDLEEALQEAMDYVDSLQEGQQSTGSLHQPLHSQQQNKDVMNKDTLVKNLTDEGFPKHLAQRASKEDDVNSFEEGLQWCMDHVDDMDQFSDDSHTDSEEETQMEEEERSEQVVGQRLREWLTRTETVSQSVIGWLENMNRKKEGNTLEALICNLGSVWRKFLETVSASGTDFLSFEHLGIVLRCLAAKEAATVQYLDWFKDVQKSHGSVERTSMSQVGNINARGLFRLGRGAKRGMDLHRIILLSVSEDNEGKIPARQYSYEELLDLQSRLMLVAGQAEKGKENVDRFITVMESLVRLGKTYVQLCKDGCVLFLDWGVKFLCDVERPVCCVSEFSKQGKLKGHRTLGGHGTGKAEEMEDFIAGVAGFLEHCHREWLVYVDQKRKDYPELNVYTVEQLVFLQQQLVKVGFGDVSNLVFPMLSLLKADCSPKDLEEALQEAMDYVDSLQEGQQSTGSLHQPLHSQQQNKDVMNKDTLVKNLTDEGFPKHLAQRASKEDDVNSFEEGLQWCMDHVDDMDQFSDDSHTDSEEETQMEEEERSEQVVGQRLREWLTRTETVSQSVIGWLENMNRKKEGNTLEALICNLGSVWRKFLETVSASGTDFLSFEHLGIVLRCLAAKDKRQFNRSLPPNFKQKVPNLVICPKSEVLNVVTYMYMFPQNENSLLPQPDEVLLCTENTTFEQVDIFLRRAYFGIQQKVYCLAFADSLDYDVGEKSEKKIKEYSTSDDRKFNLVVVCTSENEYRARIVAALEKHRCPSPPLSDTNLVRNYLGLQFAHNMAGGQSASASDPEGLCVRVVKSHRSGVGKTLYKQRLTAKLKARFPQERRPLSITIPLHSRVADIHNIAACLLHSTLDPADTLPRIVHLDISYQVQEGVDHLLYNLLVLGCVTDSHGKVWLRSPLDHYLVETMPLQDQKDPQRGRVLVHQILNVLPSLSCWSPLDSLNILKNPKSMPGYQQHDQLFDDQEFRSEMYQRPFRYLHDLDTEGQQQQGPNALMDNKVHCLTILLKYCGVTNPSWSELTHFVHFLNKQLMDFENSVYCSMAASADLPGFSVFVLRFLIQMSRDFATRSLNMSEESLSALERDADENDIHQYEMRRTWESSPHPYIFFNPDEHSMTFLGFSIESASGNLVDQQTGQVLEKGIMSRQLYQALVLNRVPLTESFDILPRQDRLLRLYRVLGLHDEEIFDNNQIIDPDPTYELTTDNVKKILAIYMRFRCNIPVIVMGETGCGKTRLVKFLCSLQTPRQNNISTMVLVKVHGGTTGEDIIKKVEAAEKVAQRNAAEIQHRPVYTVLFFDEANTTEAVGVIKEVMCDGTLSGQLSNLSLSLKMVAACNPYRKHSDDLIKRLENAGLGYHVNADKTVDKLGKVPMRRLVYRVQPLPQSMLPLVWDFGQLNRQVEELYIRQMVKRYVQNDQLGDLDEAGVNVLCKILMESQEFMRKLADECSFVSLRDVERALTVMSWFLEQAWGSGVMFQLLETKLLPEQEESEDEEEEDQEEESLNSDVNAETESDWQDVSDITKALVLSLGVCYRACLRSKETYDRHIINFFHPPFTLPDGVEQFALIIDRCQEVFLDNVHLEENIAPNQALKENVFMMVVCVELRIPLFLVGKPGSSKSLAKTIVADAMQGNSAYSELFKTFKQAQMVSFQCSPLATADGILGTFRQCAQFQRDKNKDRFVSVVVLDEVGLAEDSPKMPLKTLHPLLEDGCPGDEVPDDSKKVAFIGISNWALDPAKMNRGILVQRDIPDQEELNETARGICTTQDERTLQNMETLIPHLAKAYLKIFDEAKLKREFFGLRDFYSLVKMVYAFAARSKRKPSPCELIAAIRRNFGGLDSVDPVEFFKKQLPHKLNDEKARRGDPDCSASGLIKAALSGDDMGGESRYLLLLTENYGGLSILSENLLADRRVVPIFGSSFPKDQEYTQICRNINRIKVCMEVGQTVILLNLENLYESLYDALNQYYAMLGGERYVDLGLGTHRVKCRVHRQFRLMVVAEKQVVYNKFPIPLINRLEKHFLTLNNIMTDAQLNMARRLENWAKEYVNAAPSGIIYRFFVRNRKEETVGDVFMGFHPDTAPAIVLKVWSKLQVDGRPPSEEQVLGECQRMLLWCATPDAVMRSQSKQWNEVYFQEQQHEHLQQYLYQQFQQHTPMIMAQVTTHSKLLSERERMELCNSLPVTSITLLSLQAFDTEQQFCQQLRLFFGDREQGMKLLVVQCDCGDINQNLIKCAQYCMQDLWPADSTQHHVVFIIQLPRVAGACFTGFLGGNWHCLHIDDLRKTERPVPSMHLLQSHSPAELIMASEPTAHHSQHNVYVHTDSHIQQNMVAGDNKKEAALGSTPEQMEVDELDVEDVHTQMEAAVNTAACPAAPDSSQPDGFDPEYVRHLFITSVQAAVALVRDAEDSNAHRATHRITMLLHLIDENPEFFHGLHKLVGTILMEKEQKALKAERWLSEEAAKLDSVKKAGTFRRAWMQYVENKVVLVLAGAVAYLDTNHNLDILYTCHTQQPPAPAAPQWVARLWLAILQGGVCRLSYKQLLSVSGKDDLDEFTVTHTGAGALSFSARLPFSWMLWEVVDTAICGAKNMEGDLLNTAGSVVEQSLLGKCIQIQLSGSKENLQHMFHLYISDLLHLTFPLMGAQHELLCGCVEKGLEQLHINLVQMEVGRGLVALHVLVDQMRSRLQSVLDMAGVRPRAVEALKARPDGPCADLLNTPDEMTEDIVLLRLLVEELQPCPTQFRSEEGCIEWTRHYTTFAPVVLRILSDSDPALQLKEKVEGEEEEEELDDIEGRRVILPYGDRCKLQLTSIRCIWTRLTAVKLFFDFVGPLRQGPEKLSKALEYVKFQLLWNLLGEDADMKSVKTLKQLDKFIKTANGCMIRGLLGRIGKCSFCKKKLEATPVELPCKHILCNSCYRDCNYGKRNETKCPECKAQVPRNFDPAAAGCQDREAAELLGRYQRQVSGFLMAVVSQLCFAGKEPPEPEAVRHIFSYIIHTSKGRTLLQTKQMTVHDDLIDPTPVLRSFLLRLLLKHSEKEVHGYLNEFLENTQKLAEQQSKLAVSTKASSAPTLLEFCLLIIHCREELHYEQASLNSTDTLQSVDQLVFLANKLYNTRRQLMGQRHLEVLTVLYLLGFMRYALDTCAHILHDTFTVAGTGEPLRLSEPREDLLAELQLVCTDHATDWPKKFLIKQLCREYGIENYMALTKVAQEHPVLHWMILESGNKVEEVADRYLVCPDLYKDIRDEFAQLKVTGNAQAMMQILQRNPLSNEIKEVLLLLAIHREVATTVMLKIPEDVQTKMVDAIRAFVGKCDVIQDKALAHQLCSNEPGSVHCIQPTQDLGEQSLICLLTHLQLVLRQGAYKSNLLHPLSTLAFQPAMMAQSLLPTMPQDNLEEILKGMGKSSHGVYPTVWSCPNGHRYLVGDCGRPVPVDARCNTCGTKIGGKGNNIIQDNNVEHMDVKKADQTKTGHILGVAAQRGLESLPERHLSAVECALLRFLTHAALYLGASNPAQRDAVVQMVNPRIAPDEVYKFFWDHLRHDLQVLQKVLGRSADDVYLILHNLCQEFTTHQQKATQVLLATKKERADWEKIFATRCAQPCIQTIDAVLTKGNMVVASDKRQGDGTLLSLVYEMNETAPAQGNADISNLQNTCAVWRYRPRITVEHFFRHFNLEVESRQSMKGKFQVLRLFRMEQHIVHALHYVPSILAGQKRLMMQLHCRLDRAEAATLTIAKVMSRKDCAGLNELLKNFSKAWEIVKEHLITYSCMTPIEGLVSVPEEFHNCSITKESPVAVLLPSTHGPGLCAYVLLQFLLSRHNDFLERYCPLVNQSYKQMQEVTVRNIAQRHLVGCSPERDILPMVLAHCNYSLMVGEAATHDYDFIAFEQQLTDSVLQCKARVQRAQAGCIPVETMVYRADTTSSRLFKILREKINQECLSPAERRQIVEDLRDNLPDICLSIDNLNTALSFLKALGGDPLLSVHEFMSSALRMKRTICSRKAQQLCSLTHVQSLWVVLCYQRATILAAHHQDAFDSVEKELREELSPEQVEEMEAVCQHMSIERLELLLLQLFELIMLRLSEPRDQDDDTQPEHISLRDMLGQHVEYPLYSKEPVELSSRLLTVDNIASFPESVECRHATATWILCRSQLSSKLQMLM